MGNCRWKITFCSQSLLTDTHIFFGYHNHVENVIGSVCTHKNWLFSLHPIAFLVKRKTFFRRTQFCYDILNIQHMRVDYVAISVRRCIRDKKRICIERSRDTGQLTVEYNLALKKQLASVSNFKHFSETILLNNM